MFTICWSFICLILLRSHRIRSYDVKPPQMSKKEKVEPAKLDLLVQNLNPALAQEVIDSWIDPGKFTAENHVETGRKTLWDFSILT